MNQIIQKLKNSFESKKYRYAVIIAGAVIIVLIIYFFNLFPALEKIVQQFGPQAKVIDDEPIIPKTERINPIDGRIIQKGNYDISLVPKSKKEEVIVVKAKLTLKGSYDSAIVKAREWSEDAKLVFIKSLGAIDLGGKSSGWQITFGSKTKKAGYEIIIQAEKIISQKEIGSDSYGYDLPKNWYDSNEAIISIQALPQFFDKTISAINFFYDKDSKWWMYALATSGGNTSIFVK